jgi:hypothetical protein
MPLTPDEHRWETLWGELMKVQETGGTYCINHAGQIYITVKDLERVPSGCGCCQSKYQAMMLTGELKSKELDNNDAWVDYEGCMSQYYIYCKKFEKDENSDDPQGAECSDILFKGYTDDGYICHRFLEL